MTAPKLFEVEKIYIWLPNAEEAICYTVVPEAWGKAAQNHPEDESLISKWSLTDGIICIYQQDNGLGEVLYGAYKRWDCCIFSRELTIKPDWWDQDV